jgi:Bacterial dnaA  protein
MRQIALPLDELRGGGSSSLIITDANATAFAGLGNASAWPGRCAILVGSARSGKSLMARYFSGQGGTVIDDADASDAETLFNAWNRAQESGTQLLLVSRWRPADWQIELPDLRSRLGAALLLEISPPDDEMIEQLLQKQLADRGAAISIDALSYVKRRIERSYAAIEAFARNANARAMAENAPVNLALVKKVLEA